MRADVWPALPLADWHGPATRCSCGPRSSARSGWSSTPLLNHWWNVPLYVSARGLTTSLIPRGERAFQIDFDLIDHRLRHHRDGRGDGDDGARAADGGRLLRRADGAPRRPRACRPSIWTMPVEIPDAIPFDVDTQHSTYDAGPGPPLLAGAGPDGPGLRGVPQPVRRQGQSGPPVLGWRSTSPSPGSPGARPRSTPAARRTADPTSCTRPTPTR